MMRSERFHEDFSRQTDDARPSERSLGVTFAAVCAIVGLIRMYHGEGFATLWLIAAGAFLFCALLWPMPLRPLGILWHRLGLVLSRVISPAVMAILFFGTVVPIGLILRLIGNDPLRLKLDRKCASYWQARHPPGPAAQEMKNQF